MTISLRTSSIPLIDYFNASRDKVKFVALVSPTCGPCLRGARAVLTELARGKYHTNIDIIIIWIDMLEGDNETTAGNSTKTFQDERVTQFHDPSRLAGRAIAESLGANDAIAWDMYLFYDRESKWEKKPPAPLDWAHQLSDPWANQDHFAWGDNLPLRLREIARRLFED